ncbi:MAG: hypothetical protein RLZZ67_16 [Candidatus Parcubacteria bacterium]|jgi:GNAT superfamily N-acetyltransferase
MHTIKIVSFIPAIQALHSSASNDPKFMLCLAILFGGDRAACCDEAAVVEIDGRIAALASISPNGEMDSGQPTIVGLYTLPEFRRRCFAKVALQSAIHRMRERGFAKIRLDALTRGSLRVVGTLPVADRELLEVHDMSAFGACLE